MATSITAPGDPVTADATYTAVFSKDPTQWATITYMGNTNTGCTMPDATGTAYIDGETITVTGNMAVHAQWSENDKYGVAYINNGGLGSMTDSTIYYDNDTVTIQSNILTKPGFTFVNWKTQNNVYYNSGDSFQIHDDTLLIAQWQNDPSQWTTIEYNKNNPDAQGAMTNETVLLGDPHVLTTNSYTLTNFTFAGWNTEPNGQGTPYGNGVPLTPTQSGTLTLYAQWTENPKYSINYYANNETPDFISGTPDYVGTIKTIFPGDTFSYANHDFVRWNTLLDGTGDSYAQNSSISLNQNLTLYAIWRERNLYTVTYNDGFSTGTFSNSQYADADADGNIDITVADNPFIHYGYEFKDWITTTNVIAYPRSVIYDAQTNFTFTAEWTPITYNIAYELNGGTVNGVNPNQYNIETPTFDLFNPTKPGYTFDGWTPGLTPYSIGNLTETIGQGSMGDLAFTANWVKDASQWSKITFVNSNPFQGTLGGTLTYEGLKGDTTNRSY